MTGDRGRRAGLGLVLLLSLAVHARALSCGFAYDDRRFVTENPRIAEFGDPARFFADPATADPSRTPDIYRPLRTLLFAAERAAFGLAPAAWHLLPVLLHAANAALVYLLLIRLGAGAGAAAAGAAVFAAHPAQVEAVAWVAALADPLSASFTLLAVLAWLRSRGPDRWYAAALGCGLLACLSKEAALVFPGYLLLADLARPDGGGPGAVRERRWAYAAPVLLAAGFGLAVRALLASARGGQLGHLGAWWGGSFGANLATAAKAGAYQVLFAAFPFAPSAEWYVEPARSALDPGAILCGGGLLALLGAAAAGAWRGGTGARLAGTGVLLGALGALMTANLLFTVGIPRADRFLYLSLAGAAMVHAALYGRLARAAPRAAPALAAAAVLAMGGISLDRIGAWRDEDAFWREGPAGLYAPRAESRRLSGLNSGGVDLLSRAAEAQAAGDGAGARRLLAEARSALEAAAAGAAALNAEYRRLVGIAVDAKLEARARRNLALAHLRLEDPAAALAALAAAEPLDPGGPRALHLEALALLARGRVQRAGWRIEASLAGGDPGLSASEAARVLNEAAAWRLSRGLDGAALRALRRSAALVPDAARNPAVGQLPGLERAVEARRRALAAEADARPGDFGARAAAILYEGRGGGDMEAARAAFGRAFGGAPEEAATRTLWTLATVEADDTEAGWRAAEAQHRETLARYAGDAGAMLGLARCREALEDPSGAAGLYRAVRDLPAVSADARREAEEGLQRTEGGR